MTVGAGQAWRRSLDRLRRGAHHVHRRLVGLREGGDADDLQGTGGEASLAHPGGLGGDNAISEGGDTEIRYCTGYETEGPGCKTATARLDAAALAAIRQAALASGLATSPAQEVPQPMVGGSTRGGTVWLDKQKITLSAQPVAADVPRVQSVLDAIISALPEGLIARVMPGN